MLLRRRSLGTLMIWIRNAGGSTRRKVSMNREDSITQRE
jgi:hypothetical protein